MGEFPIYLDNQATTPVDPRSLEAMLPYFTENFGNPHSDGHPYGWRANADLELNREYVSQLIGADPREVIFTSGATESCNLALRGIAKPPPNSRRKIVTLATEHSCVLETCAALEKVGFEVVVLPVKSDGIVDLDVIRHSVDDQTLVVSVMIANNETGVIQPIKEIVEISRRSGAITHSDATQAVGKIPVNVRDLDIDLLSFSAHKLYGPKGIGALFLRWDSFSKIKPIISGGGQEGGLRPGTVPVPLTVGFGEACRIASVEMQEDIKHTGRLSKLLYNLLCENQPNLRLFGHPAKRLPGNLNIGFPGFSGDEIIDRIGDQIALSTGSACSSGTVKISHVISALEKNDEIANTAIRISIGRFNTEKEIRNAAKTLVNATS